MKKNLNLFYLPVFFLLFTFCTHSPSARKNPKKEIPKNIILIIGDGMGHASLTASRIWSQGSQGALNMETLDFMGAAKTYSASGFVTDSAASGTALSTGVKTYNGAIGLSWAKKDPSGRSRKLQHIIEVMKNSGKATGVITTTRVTHATPAAFYAHVKQRNMEDEIALMVKDSSLDLLMGGGKKHFFPKNKMGERVFKGRKDGRNIAKDLKKSGWSYVGSKSEMIAYKEKSLKGPLLGLFNPSHMSYETERLSKAKDLEPSFTEMSEFAVDFLSDNKEGFFLMIEAGRIDHASHKNDIVNMIQETLALDDFVGKILKNPIMKDTLLVITADHETGGLALNGYGDMARTKGDELLKIENIGHYSQSSYISWGSGPNSKENPKASKEKFFHSVAQYDADASHTAVDVPILSSGPGASSFIGYMNNTEIPKRILSLLDLEFTEESNKENPAG